MKGRDLLTRCKRRSKTHARDVDSRLPSSLSGQFVPYSHPNLPKSGRTYTGGYTTDTWKSFCWLLYRNFLNCLVGREWLEHSTYGLRVRKPLRGNLFDGNLARANDTDKPPSGQSQLSYRTLVELKSTELASRGQRFKLTPGMQVSAEINLGTRTVLQYLLSPIQKTLHEAWRER